MCSIDWNKSAEEIERLIRGMDPWPSAYTRLDDKNVKIWKAKVIPQDASATPGTITEITKDGIYVQTGEGTLAVLELQMEGKKRMTTDAFLRGYEVKPGTVLRRG